MATALASFEVKPKNRAAPYYGFTLKGSPLHVMPNGVIFHNSGKSVLEQSS